MTRALSIISSMATRRALADLTHAFAGQTGRQVDLLSIGGLEAAGRVRSGEPFDVVVLATDALQKLAAAGLVEAQSITAFACSPTAVAVRSGAARPDNCDEEAIRTLVRNAGAIGISTGPSGASLRRLMSAWGLDDEISRHLVQAPTGTPVAELIAAGQVDLGFQQLSEMLGEPGIDVIGTLPEVLVPLTVFAMGIPRSAIDVGGANALIAYLASSAADAVLRLHGLQSV